jgi:hypothetical protein
MRASLSVLAMLMILTLTQGSPRAASLDGLAVDVRNASEPVLCAEKDNVTVEFANPQVRRFEIEVVHPVYIGGIRKDSFEPDWTACEDISEATSAVPPARKVTFYEDVDLWLTGYRFENFWRDRDVPFRIGDRVERGLHLVQLWVRHEERAEEVVVVYPADGYWRARPLPPVHLGGSAYGSSFLLGPIKQDGRPVVELTGISFDPLTKTFRLDFADGGSATMQVADLTRERMVLAVELDRSIESGPFAALRSMYVTELNADVARIALRPEQSRAWIEEPIMRFQNTRATDVWTGRMVPSRHNTSAPDMVFRKFRGARASDSAQERRSTP